MNIANTNAVGRQQVSGIRSSYLVLAALVLALNYPATAHFVRVDFSDFPVAVPSRFDAAGTNIFGIGFNPADTWAGTGTVDVIPGDLVAPAGLNYTVTQSGLAAAAQGDFSDARMNQRDLEFPIGANPTWVSFLIQPVTAGSAGGVALNIGGFNPRNVGNGQFIGIENGDDLVVDTGPGEENDTIVPDLFTLGETALVVVKIEHLVDVGGIDRITVWVNQDVDNLTSANAAVEEFFGNATDRIIRIGVASWDDNGVGIREGAIVDNIILSDNPPNALSEVVKTGTGDSGPQIVTGLWDGGSLANSNLTTPENWENDVAPDFVDGAVTSFTDNNNGRTNPVFDTPGLVLNNAEIEVGTTAAYTFTGNGFQLNDNIRNRSTGMLTIDTGMINAVDGSLVSAVAGSGGITIRSDINLGGGLPENPLDQNDEITFEWFARETNLMSGKLTGPGNIAFLGEGTVSVTNTANDFTGQLVIGLFNQDFVIDDPAILGDPGPLPKVFVQGRDTRATSVVFATAVALDESFALEGRSGQNLIDNPAVTFTTGTNSISGDVFGHDFGEASTIQVDGTSLAITGEVSNRAEDTPSERIIEFRGSGNVTCSGGTSDGQIDNDEPNGVFPPTGVRSGVGNGSLILSGSNNTHTGQTSVVEGALVLVDATSMNNVPNSNLIKTSDGAMLDVSGLMSSTLALASGQRLEHGGMANGTIVATAGSSIAPGDGIGTGNFNNLALQDGSTLLIEISESSDLIEVTGTYTGPASTGGVTINIANVGASIGTTTIMRTNSALSVADYTVTGELAEITTLQLVDGGTDLEVVIAAPANPAATVLVTVADVLGPDRDDLDEITDIDNVLEFAVTEGGLWLSNGVKIEGATCCGLFPLANPWGIATDLAGNIYVAERLEFTGTILKFDPNGMLVGVPAEEGNQFINGRPSGVAIDSSDPQNELLYFTTGGDQDAIYVVNLNTQQFDTLVPKNFDLDTPRSLEEPEGIEVLPSGNIVVGQRVSGDNFTGEFLEFDPAGNFVAVRPAGEASGVSYDEFNEVMLLSRNFSTGRVQFLFADTLLGSPTAIDVFGTGNTADVEQIIDRTYVTRPGTGEIFRVQDTPGVVVDGLPNVAHMLVTSNTHPLDLDNDGLLIGGGGEVDDAPDFIGCVSGPGNTTPPVGCSAADFRRIDLDDDGDVDADDLALYTVLVTTF